MSHTPGPWCIERTKWSYYVIDCANGKPIAWVTYRKRMKAIEEAANALLIAAAPDLLKACQAAFEHTFLGYADARAQREAEAKVARICQAAIYKAKGEEE